MKPVRISQVATHLFLLVSLLVVALWSAICPHDYFIWFLETLPALVAIVLLLITYKRFQLSLLLYVLIWLHCIVLFVGGHYTYELVPLFDNLRDFFGHARNNYDKLGHFAQGFVPAIAARELLIRTSTLKRGKWMVALILLGVLGISAAYEIIEWFSALALGDGSDAFLGTQGDIWDAQSDMLCAFIGATSALLLLSKAHDRSLKKQGVD